MRKRKSAPQDKNQDALLGEIQRLRKQIHQLQLERDILTKANELIKKDLGVSFLKLKNREKTLIVDALKKKYCRFNWSTQQLCENMGLRRFFE